MIPALGNHTLYITIYHICLIGFVMASFKTRDNLHSQVKFTKESWVGCFQRVLCTPGRREGQPVKFLDSDQGQTPRLHIPLQLHPRGLGQVTVTGETCKVLGKQVPFFLFTAWLASVALQIWLTCSPTTHSHKLDCHPADLSYSWDRCHALIQTTN